MAASSSSWSILRLALAALSMAAAATEAAQPTITKLSCGPDASSLTPFVLPADKCQYEVLGASTLGAALCGSDKAYLWVEQNGATATTFSVQAKLSTFSGCGYPVGTAAAENAADVATSKVTVANDGAYNEVSALTFPTKALDGTLCKNGILILTLLADSTPHDAISIPFKLTDCTPTAYDMSIADGKSITAYAAVAVGTPILTPTGGLNLPTVDIANFDNCPQVKAYASMVYTDDADLIATFLSTRKDSGKLGPYTTAAGKDPLYKRVMSLATSDLAHEVDIVDVANKKLTFANVKAPWPNNRTGSATIKGQLSVVLDPFNECDGESDLSNQIAPFPISVTGVDPANAPDLTCLHYPSGVDNGASVYVSNIKAGKNLKVTGKTIVESPAADFDQAVDNAAFKMTGLSADHCGKHCTEMYKRLNGAVGQTVELAEKTSAFLAKVLAQVTVLKGAASGDKQADLTKYEILVTAVNEMVKAAATNADGEGKRLGKWLFAGLMEYASQPADASTDCGTVVKALREIRDALATCKGNGCSAGSLSVPGEYTSCLCTKTWGGTPATTEVCGGSKWASVLHKKVVEMFVKKEAMPTDMPSLSSQLVTDTLKELNKVSPTLKAALLLPLTDAVTKTVLADVTTKLTTVKNANAAADGVKLVNKLIELVAGIDGDAGSVTALTDVLKVLQKPIRDTAVGCELGATLYDGEKPTEKEFCEGLRRHEYAKELKCRVAKETNGQTVDKDVIKAMYGLDTYALRPKAPVACDTSDEFSKRAPIVWKRKGSFVTSIAYCSHTASFTHTQVVKCGSCENC